MRTRVRGRETGTNKKRQRVLRRSRRGVDPSRVEQERRRRLGEISRSPIALVSQSARRENGKISGNTSKREEKEDNDVPEVVYNARLKPSKRVIRRAPGLLQHIINQQRKPVPPLAGHSRLFNPHPTNDPLRDRRRDRRTVREEHGKRSPECSVTDERRGRLEDAVEAPAGYAVEEEAGEETLEDCGRAGDKGGAGNQADTAHARRRLAEGEGKEGREEGEDVRRDVVV